MKKKLLISSIIINLLLLAILGYAVHRLGGLNAIMFRIKNGGISGTYDHRTKILNELPIINTDIVFLGNSITEYGEWREFFGNEHIKNRGIAGEFTDGVQRRLPQILAGQPRKIFLMIGINDLIMYRPPHILTNYRQIIEQVRQESPQTKLYLQSIIPVNNNVKQTSLSNADVLTLNNGIRQMSTEFGLEYVDLHALLRDSEGNLDAQYTSDGIHVNHLAYAVWVNKIQDMVNEGQ